MLSRIRNSVSEIDYEIKEYSSSSSSSSDIEWIVNEVYNNIKNTDTANTNKFTS